MTDAKLVKRLRQGARYIFSINPSDAALLLEEAADVIEASERSLASANAAHRTEIARADARFATITTLRSILGGASEAEIIENARAAVLASEIPDHRGPLTDAELEAIGEPDPAERERLQSALDAAGTILAAALKLGVSPRRMKLLMVQHRPEWPRAKPSGPDAEYKARIRSYFPAPNRPSIDKDAPLGEVKRFAWMEVGGVRFENVEIEQGPLQHPVLFNPADFGAINPEHATQEQAERLLGLDVPDSTMASKGARLEVVGGDGETIRALGLPEPINQLRTRRLYSTPPEGPLAPIDHRPPRSHKHGA